MRPAPLAIGLPSGLLAVRRDTGAAEVNVRIKPGEPYFQDLRERRPGALPAAQRRNLPFFSQTMGFRRRVFDR